MTSGRHGVEWLNTLPAPDAEHELLSCCGSRTWAVAVTAARPFPDMAALAAATDTALAALAWSDLEEALAHHPRIGERPKGTGRASAWSRAEQSGVHPADPAGETAATGQALRAGNLAYERRFGHVFLVCAAGLSGGQLLTLLRSRLGNDVATEREIVRAELMKIAHLRLARLLEHP